MTGTSATLASNTDCIMVQEVEAFTVTANGQTAFTLAFIPSGDVMMQVNGSGRMHSITAVGVNATYTPAINGGYVLQTGDEVEVAYARMVCTSPDGAGTPLDYATGAEYPQTGDAQLTTPAYVAAAIAAIPADLTTPLADVAALTDASRGLSLGEVDIPTNRALTIAEMTQPNANRVSIPLGDIQAVFTNRAAEPAATGYMNADGSLGGHLPSFFTDTANAAAVIAAAISGYNDFRVQIEVVSGDTVPIPPPAYTGQLMTLNVYLPSSTFGEAVLTSNGFPGIARRRNHKMANFGDVFTGGSIIVRDAELIHFVGQDNLWTVISHNFYLFEGANWREYADGTVSILVTTPYISEGAVGTVPLPLAVANTSYHVHITNGAPGAGPGTFVDAPEGLMVARTFTSFDVLAKQLGSLTVENFSFVCHIPSVPPDYAALGGIASF